MDVKICKICNSSHFEKGCRCKKCISDQRKMYSKRYALKVAVSQVEWANKNRSRKNKLSREWRKNNSEKVKITKRKSYIKRIAKARNERRIWVALNRKNINYSNNKRRYIIDQTGVFTHEEWLQIKIKHNNTCLCCLKKEPEIKLTIDHVIPLSKGGLNICENIQPLCQSCNSKKHAKIIDYRLEFNQI